MKEKVESMIIVCDCCGDHFHDGNDHCCYINDHDGSDIEQEALGSYWIKVGDKHYCDRCYTIDEDDNIVTKDGHKYNPDTLEEI